MKAEQRKRNANASSIWNGSNCMHVAARKGLTFMGQFLAITHTLFPQIIY